MPDLSRFDIIIVNSSAGKDSQTALHSVMTLADRQHQPRSKITVSHQDLGEMEWPGSKDLAESQARHYGVRFEVSKYRSKTGEHLSLLEYIEKRGRWPDNNNRYCTSDFKRGPGSRVVTLLSKEARSSGVRRPVILHVFGFRAEESPARRKKVVFAPNKILTRGTQEVWDWLPIHTMPEAQVWDTIKDSGVPHHPAYDLGMPRLSCVFCIFAPKAALIIAGRNMPGLMDRYVSLEEKMGHTFRNKMPLAEIREAVLRGDEVECTDGAWNM